MSLINKFLLINDLLDEIKDEMNKPNEFVALADAQNAMEILKEAFEQTKDITQE